MLIRTRTLLSASAIGVFAALLTGLIIGYLASEQAGSALEKQVSNQLTSLRDAKKNQIEDYIKTIELQAVDLAQTPSIKTALPIFEHAYDLFAEQTALLEKTDYQQAAQRYYQDAFNTEYQVRNNQRNADINQIVNPLSDTALRLQNRFIYANPNALGSKDLLIDANDGTSYARAHNQFHPTFRHFQQTFGYYDLFLVDNSGRVVYSVFKEADFATSLAEGPFAKSGLAEAFKQSRQLNAGEVYIDDFKTYTPSYEDPAAFISTPVFDGDNRLGALIFQFPIDKINQIMTFNNDWQNQGMGSTGETFLVGSDHKLRSQRRGLAEHPEVFLEELKRSNFNADMIEQIDSKKTSIAIMELKSSTIDRALEGKTGVEFDQNYRNQETIIAFTPLNIPGTNWALLAEMETNEAFASERTLVADITLYVILVVFVICLLAALFGLQLAKQITAPLLLVKQTLLSLASNDSQQVEIPTRNDEIGDIFTSLGELVGKLENDAKEQRVLATNNGRIKEALDVCTASVCVADANRQIIYCNQELDKLLETSKDSIRTLLPNFDITAIKSFALEDFMSNSQDIKTKLARLQNPLEQRMVIGAHTFDCVTIPVRSDEQLIGYVMEWKDITQELAIEDEVQQLVNRASSGNLSQRLSTTGKTGFYARLATELNSLLSVTESALSDIALLLSKLAEGDLRTSITREYEGTFGTICVDANQTIHKLTDIIGNISRTSQQVSTGAREIAQANTSLQARTEEQAASLEETAASIKQLSETVEQTTQQTSEVNSVVIAASTQAEAGERSVKDVVESMEQIKKSSNEIANIIGVIDEIAFQTNLLALNAAVEAARAGEEGRGFAVVAGEVRMLAQRSAAAAGDIKKLIQDSMQKVQLGVERANVSGDVLQELIVAMKEVRALVDKVSAASKDQHMGIQQVNIAISSLENMTNQNAAMVEELSATTENMADQAAEGKQTISFFKVH